jgi:lipid II:glycine glycyltransferase (peptidoglycan interpeptide bridge formation enzyme)
MVLHELSDYGPRDLCRSPNRTLETVYGGPIFTIRNKREKLDYGEQFITAVHKMHRALSIETWLSPVTNPVFLKRIGYVITPYLTPVLCLENSEETIWQEMHSKTRNSIRKANKSNVEIVAGAGKYVADYYTMVEETLGSRGVRVLPQVFYTTVIERLQPLNLARLFIATLDGNAIAGAIFLLYRDTVYYWHGASLREYSRVCANHLVQWEFIKWARQMGYKKYDLLSVEPDRLPGIARFKMRFGGKLERYHMATWKTSILRWQSIKYYYRNPRYTMSRAQKVIGGLGHCQLRSILNKKNTSK